MKSKNDMEWRMPEMQAFEKAGLGLGGGMGGSSPSPPVVGGGGGVARV